MLLLTVLLCLAGCSTTKMPHALHLIHSRWPYRIEPKFVGSDGPLSREQGDMLIERIAESSGGDMDLLQKHLAFEQAITREPLMLGNKVTLLENGGATYRAMFNAIRNARDSINLETFLFTDDAIGNEFADALIAKQEQGVQVNVIYDSLGSFHTQASFFDRMRQSGIRVLEFNPIDPRWARLRWRVDHRDHRKLTVVDGRIAFTGGINISGVYSSGIRHEEHVAQGPPDTWRDTDVELEGPVVAQCQELFLATWTYQGGPPLPPREYYPTLTPKGHAIVRVIGSVPQRFSLNYVTLVSAIDNAEKNVWLTDAYFAPEDELIKVLKAAARRGVDVRILLPENADEPLIQSAARFYYRELLRAGVKIYEWQGTMLHSKTATVDGVWSTVGSSNLDSWSILRNNEINAVVLSPRFGEAMNQMFLQDLASSHQIDPQKWGNRGLIERVREDAGWMLQSFL